MKTVRGWHSSLLWRPEPGRSRLASASPLSAPNRHVRHQFVALPGRATPAGGRREVKCNDSADVGWSCPDAETSLIDMSSVRLMARSGSGRRITLRAPRRGRCRNDEDQSGSAISGGIGRSVVRLA